MPPRPDGRSADADLVQLRDLLLEKENEMRIELETKIENHRRWNMNHVDLTSEPLPPVQRQSDQLSFRPAKTQYLMTPPASASGDEDEANAMDIDKDEAPAPAPMRYFVGAPQDSSSQPPAARFRRRIGRLKNDAHFPWCCFWVTRQARMTCRIRKSVWVSRNRIARDRLHNHHHHPSQSQCKQLSM